MKICFYCDTIFTFGGVQRVLAGIAKALSNRHEITVLTQDAPSKEDKTLYGLEKANIKYLYIHYKASPLYEHVSCKAYSFLYKKILPQNRVTTRWYSYSSFPPSKQKLLIQTLNEGNYDYIIGVHAYPSLFLAGIKKHLKAKVIGWFHTSYEAFFNQPGLWLWKLEKRFKYQAQLLDEMVVLTHHDQKLLKEKMALNSTVIYNPLTLETKGTGSPLYKKFLAVGRMNNLTKGFDILIKAFAIFSEHNKEWTLNIVGEGPDEPFLHALIAKYQLANRITIFPFTSDLQKHYALASVYILSSRWEGFGLVVIEAMAHGLPVIASNLPVCRELLEGREYCFIFKSENAEDLAHKMNLVSQSSSWDVWAKETQEYAHSFSLEHITEQWEKLLE